MNEVKPPYAATKYIRVDGLGPTDVAALLNGGNMVFKIGKATTTRSWAAMLKVRALVERIARHDETLSARSGAPIHLEPEHA